MRLDVVSNHSWRSVPSTVLPLNSNFSRTQSTISMTSLVQFAIKTVLAVECRVQFRTKLAYMVASGLRVVLFKN